MTESSLQELQRRIDEIEEAYEFMLAYAAQGLSTDEASRSGAQLREYLGRLDVTLRQIADLFAGVIDEVEIEDRDTHSAFVDVLRGDAHKAGTAVRVTLAQPAIGSQLIDNLNASIHLRALLTDIFLLDELIAPRVKASIPG